MAVYVRLAVDYERYDVAFLIAVACQALGNLSASPSIVSTFDVCHQAVELASQAPLQIMRCFRCTNDVH